MQVTDWRPTEKVETIPCLTPGCSGAMVVFGRRALCSACKTTYQRERPKRNKRTVVELTDRDVAAMLARARSSPRDFAILGLLAAGFRRSEVVGGDDNGVLLPGVTVEDIQLDQQGCRVVGKGESGRIRENLAPKRILQPVPRVILEAALGTAVKSCSIFDDVNTHEVGKMVKEYARLAGVAEWQEVRAHRLRHWYSNAVRKRIGNQGPTALLEWQDTMRHSRSSAGSVTVAFYSGEITSFERRLEICLAAFQPILEQLQNPSFLESLPALSPVPSSHPAKIDIPPVRIHGNSIFPTVPGNSERDSPLHTITYSTSTITVRDSNSSKASASPLPTLAPREGSTTREPEPSTLVWVEGQRAERTEEELLLTVKEEEKPPEIETPFATVNSHPFTDDDMSPEADPVKETALMLERESPEIGAVRSNLEEPMSEPASEPPSPPTRDQILKAWTVLRATQRHDLAEKREWIKSLWKWGERKKKLQRLHCSNPGCKNEAVAYDPPTVKGMPWPLFCQDHCLREPPDGWLPDAKRGPH